MPFELPPLLERRLNRRHWFFADVLLRLLIALKLNAPFLIEVKGQYNRGWQLDVILADALAGQADKLEEEDEPEDILGLGERHGLSINLLVAPVNLYIVVVESFAVGGLEQEGGECCLTSIAVVEDRAIEVNALYPGLTSLRV